MRHPVNFVALAAAMVLTANGMKRLSNDADKIASTKPKTEPITYSPTPAIYDPVGL